MQADQLSEILAKRYRGAAKGDTALSIHLFAIEYYEHLKGHNLAEICSIAEIPVSYARELHKGLRLAEHVILK